MNTNSWKTFFEDANMLKKPAQANQLISAREIEEVKLLLVNVLEGFLAKEDLHVGLKVYVNHELRNDFIEKMAAYPPNVELSFEDWSKHIFGDQKFGVILIGLEEYSNSFTEKAAIIVRPLLEIAGLPLDGLSFLFFMGNYGYTPFGIHKESTGEDGILFHLGPEHKEFFTWDDPKYNAIQHNSEVFHNVSEMLAEGQRYDLKPGDAMFIPHYAYHIGNTPKFSLSFVMDYINPPKDRFENELIRETAEEELINHVDYEKPLKLDSPNAVVNEIIDSQSILKKMELTLARKILRLKSNGGIRKASIKTRARLPQTDTFSIKGKEIFPLYLDVQDSENTLIYARGHRIVRKHHPLVAQVIDQLNRGESIKLAALTQLLDPMWDLIEVLGFVQELLSTEAIIVEDIKDESLD